MKDRRGLEDAKTLIGLSLLELGDRLAIIKQLARSDGRTFKHLIVFSLLAHRQGIWVEWPL